LTSLCFSSLAALDEVKQGETEKSLHKGTTIVKDDGITLKKPLSISPKTGFTWAMPDRWMKLQTGGVSVVFLPVCAGSLPSPAIRS